MFISPREILDIIVMTAVIGFIFSRFFKRQPSHDYDPLTYYEKKNTVINDILYGAMIAAPAVVLHELAHKFTAQRYGLWAEFRYDLNMLMFAMVLAFALGFAFIAPGAVMISGYYITREQNGKISVNGPLTNFMVASLALSFLIFGASGIVGTVLFYVFYINVFLGMFNLLPFGPLDGRKVEENLGAVL